jgi:serine protease
MSSYALAWLDVRSPLSSYVDMDLRKSTSVLVACALMGVSTPVITTTSHAAGQQPTTCVVVETEPDEELEPTAEVSAESTDESGTDTSPASADPSPSTSKSTFPSVEATPEPTREPTTTPEAPSASPEVSPEVSSEPSVSPDTETESESPSAGLESRSVELSDDDDAAAESSSPSASVSASPTASPSPSASVSPAASASPSEASSPTASASPSTSPTASASPSASPSVEEEGDVVVGPVVCPPQPVGLAAAAQDGGAVVTWDDVRAVVEDELAALAEDGIEDLPAADDVVTDIQVTVTAVVDASDEQVLTVTGDATQARVSGLRNGVEYAVRVIALGEFGAGPVSEPVSVVPTTGVEGEIGGVLLKRDDAAKAVPASRSAGNVDGVAVTDDGEALDGVDKVALSEAVDVVEGEAIARTIEAQPEVQWAEPDLVVLPAAVPATTDDSGTDAGAGWNITGEYGVGQVTDPDAGAGVTVAVIDTGITAHPDLDGRLVAGFDFVSNPDVFAAPRSEGADPVPFDGDYTDEATYGGMGRDADPTDPGDWRGVAPIRDSTWHGTHTAGVIADVVPGAKIQPIRALSWRGGLLSDVAAGITWASGGTVDGVPTNTTPSKVINLSFSVQAACPNTLQTAIDDAVARGSVIVAAAGNNNDDATGYAPGNCANVITVGATNADGKRATYSNYGTVVDASAPGETQRTEREGTSIAAAHTAAALALIAAQQPDLTPNELAAELTGTYLRAFPGDKCDEAGDRSCGVGIVQIASGTTRVVTSVADTVDSTDGVLTLREAITAANSSSGDTITFDPSILPATIQMSSSLDRFNETDDDLRPR